MIVGVSSARGVPARAGPDLGRLRLMYNVCACFAVDLAAPSRRLFSVGGDRVSNAHHE